MALNSYFESLDQIAATLAHEVKNPISIVRANIDFLELEDEDEAHIKNYRVMRKELERVFDLLQNFISFNLPSGKNAEYRSLNQMLEEAASGFDCKSGCEGLIRLSLPDEDIPVFCDHDKLQRAFINFIKNAYEAVEASSREDGAVEIEVRRAGDVITVKINDNGVGMTQEELEKLDTVFFTSKKNGSGIGFQIASNAIREHGGEVKVDSVKNAGTAVTIKIPEKRQMPNS